MSQELLNRRNDLYKIRTEQMGQYPLYDIKQYNSTKMERLLTRLTLTFNN